MKASKYVIFIFFLLFASVGYSVITEDTNESKWNFSVTTGLSAGIVEFCDTDADCGSYECFLDYDSVAGGGKPGYCRPQENTECPHDGSWFGASFVDGCFNDTHTRRCDNGDSGDWEFITNSSCEDDEEENTTTTAASSSDSGGSSDGSGSSSSSDTSKYDIDVTSSIEDFDITQGESLIKSLTVENSGDKSLDDLAVALSGIKAAWYSVSPDEFDDFDPNETKTFIVNFSIPSNGSISDIGDFDVTVSITSDNHEEEVSFDLKVLPSNETVQNEIIPKYDNFIVYLDQLLVNLTRLQSSGQNTTELEEKLSEMQEKLNKTRDEIEAGNYFEAGNLLNDLENLRIEVEQQFEDVQLQDSGLILIIILVVVILIIAAVLAYMFWPVSEASFKKAGFKPPTLGKKSSKGGSKSSKSSKSGKKSNPVKSILDKLKKKKVNKFRYEFGSS